jgi:transcriptional regulator with XRE-family HTH domain
MVVKFDRNALASRLALFIRAENTTVSAVAKQLGVSQNYLSELLAGKKSLLVASDNLLREIAKYLNLPTVLCFVMAGRLTHEDFVEPSLDFDQKLDMAVTTISESAEGIESGVDAEMLLQIPKAGKVLITLLFQRLNQVELIPEKRWQWLSEKRSIFSTLLRAD